MQFQQTTFSSNNMAYPAQPYYLNNPAGFQFHPAHGVPPPSAQYTHVQSYPSQSTQQPVLVFRNDPQPGYVQSYATASAYGAPTQAGAYAAQGVGGYGMVPIACQHFAAGEVPTSSFQNISPADTSAEVVPTCSVQDFPPADTRVLPMAPSANSHPELMVKDNASQSSSCTVPLPEYTGVVQQLQPEVPGKVQSLTSSDQPATKASALVGKRPSIEIPQDMCKQVLFASSVGDHMDSFSTVSVCMIKKKKDQIGVSVNGHEECKVWKTKRSKTTKKTKKTNLPRAATAPVVSKPCLDSGSNGTARTTTTAVITRDIKGEKEAMVWLPTGTEVKNVMLNKTGQTVCMLSHNGRLLQGEISAAGEKDKKLLEDVEQQLPRAKVLTANAKLVQDPRCQTITETSKVLGATFILIEERGEWCHLGTMADGNLASNGWIRKNELSEISAEHRKLARFVELTKNFIVTPTKAVQNETSEKDEDETSGSKTESEEWCDADDESMEDWEYDVTF